MEENKYALITGASRGIGRATAIKLAKLGYSVIINYASNEEAARKTLAEIVEAGGKAELLPFDVCNADAVNEALGAWQARHENEYIAVLVNNAGIRRDALMMWSAREDWHSVVATSLDGFFNVTQPLLKDMLVRKYGRIVNMASLSGLQTDYNTDCRGIEHGLYDSETVCR